MKIRDIISEASDKVTPLKKHQDRVGKGVTRSRDVGGYDRVYHLNRIGMAMAMADGENTKAVDSPAETWFEKYNTYHPLTKEEDNMIKQAHKTVPSNEKVVSSYGKSKEPTGTNTTSPVAKPKKNKYGV
jgi:hypothetical protein